MTNLTKIKLGAAALALLGLALWAIYTSGLRNELFLKGKELDAAQTEAAGLALELEANRRALADREAEKERLANEYAALAATLEEVYKNDPDAKAWADELCPVSVLDCLR